MLEFYPQIRSVHIAAISLSGLWMVARGLAAIAGMRWPSSLLARGLAWTIDGTLLTAAAMLLNILPGEMFANGWLELKVPLVIVYLVCGYWSLRARASRSARIGYLAASLAAFVLVYGIARAHNPLGWLA